MVFTHSFVLFLSAFAVAKCQTDYPGPDASDGCNDCVDNGNTYCLNNGFFGDPSVCVDSDKINTGTFGGCDDFSFGSSALTSDLDCAFNNSSGGTILAGIIAAAICFIVGIVGCCYLRFRANRRSQSFVTYTNVPQQYPPPAIYGATAVVYAQTQPQPWLGNTTTVPQTVDYQQPTAGGVVDVEDAVGPSTI